MVTKEEKIIEMIAEHIGCSKTAVVPTAKLVDDLGADSLDLVELLMYAEEQFDCEITDEEAEKCDTVQKCFDCINDHTLPC